MSFTFLGVCSAQRTILWRATFSYVFLEWFLTTDQMSFPMFVQNQHSQWDSCFQPHQLAVKALFHPWSGLIPSHLLRRGSRLTCWGPKERWFWQIAKHEKKDANCMHFVSNIPKRIFDDTALSLNAALWCGFLRDSWFVVFFVVSLQFAYVVIWVFRFWYPRTDCHFAFSKRFLATACLGYEDLLRVKTQVAFTFSVVADYFVSFQISG